MEDNMDHAKSSTVDASDDKDHSSYGKTTETERDMSTARKSSTETVTVSKYPVHQSSNSGGSKAHNRRYEAFVVPFENPPKWPTQLRQSGNTTEDIKFRHPKAVNRNNTSMSTSQSNGRKDTPIPKQASAVSLYSMRPRRFDSSEVIVPSFYDRDFDDPIVIESFGSAAYSSSNTIMPSFLTSGLYCDRKNMKRHVEDTSPASEPSNQPKPVRGNRSPINSESYDIDDFYLAPDNPIQQSIREMSSAHSTQATCASRWSSRQRERELSSDDEEFYWNSDSAESYYTTASCTSVDNLSNSYSLTFDEDYSPEEIHSATTGPLDLSESTMTEPLYQSESTITGPLNQSESTITGPLGQSKSNITVTLDQKLSNNSVAYKEHFLPPINISFPYVTNASTSQQSHLLTKEKTDFQSLPVIRQAQKTEKMQGQVCLQSIALWENGTLKVTVQSPEPKRLNPEQRKALRSIQAIDGLVRPDVTLTIVHQSTRPQRPVKSIKSSKGTRNRQKSKCTRKKKERESDIQPAADRDVIENRAALPPFDTSLDLDNNPRRQN